MCQPQVSRLAIQEAQNLTPRASPGIGKAKMFREGGTKRLNVAEERDSLRSNALCAGDKEICKTEESSKNGRALATHGRKGK